MVSVRNHENGYVIGRHVRRHRGLLAAASLVGLALAAGAVGTSVQWRRAERLRVEAEQRDVAGRRLFQAQLERLEQQAGNAEAVDGQSRAEALKKAERYLSDVRKAAGGSAAIVREVADGLTRLAGLQYLEPQTRGGAARNLQEAEDLYVWVLERSPGDDIATFGLVGARLTQADLLRQSGQSDAAEQATRRANALAEAWLLSHPGDEQSARALRELQSRLTRERATPGAARPVTPDHSSTRTFTPQPAPGHATPSSPSRPPELAGAWVQIPGGSFEMGCSAGLDPDCVDDEFPRHRARVAPFEMMRTEVTVGQYRAFARHVSVEAPPQPVWSVDDRYPVVGLPWQRAQDFCTAEGGRLPNEAEWEYAARGGRSDAAYPWGRAWDPARANAGPAEGDRFGAAAPVASFPPTAFGLHDMAGNVWEWVADWYNPSGYGPLRTGMYRVIRGGAFGSDATYLRVSQRGTRLMNPALDQIGFRCVR